MDDPKMSFVSSCRLNHTTLFFIERFTPNFADSEVALDQDGRILTYASDVEARAAIAGRFSLPRGQPLTEQSSEEEIAAALEDTYAKHVTLSYDLDAVRHWATAPGPSGITPEDALGVWELCWQVGEAPQPQRFDPMGMYAMYENIGRDPERRDAYELVLLGMKLTGIVIMGQKKRPPTDGKIDWPEMAEMWRQADYTRLGAILAKGVAGFASRVIS
jgi:hypothetical protein